MPGPAKTTSERINCRVRVGSALERILQGREDTTEVIHRMAELIEAAPPAVMAQLDPDPNLELAAKASREAIEQLARESRAAVQRMQARNENTTTGRTFTIGHDEHTHQEVTEDQVLELVREQFPAGLVPVGIDDGDQFEDDATGGTSTPVADDEPEDDLSHLA